MTKEKPSVIVGVRYSDSREVVPNGQAEEDNLESWDEELEEEESNVAVDAHKVLPAEGSDVERSWKAGEGTLCALA